MGERRGDEPSRFDEYEQTREFSLILGIAEALREEFGVGIDAHPGGQGTEAGVVNRAFLAAARIILQASVTPLNDEPLALTRTLLLVARRNLIELGVGDEQADNLLDSEPGFGDHWLAYLSLAPSSVVNDLSAGG